MYLKELQSKVNAIYQGATELPYRGDVTKVLLQKSMADNKAAIELMDAGEATEQEVENAKALAASSAQSLTLHFRELVNDQLSWARLVSLAAIFVLLIPTLGASVFVYTFFKQVFHSQEEA